MDNNVPFMKLKDACNATGLSVYFLRKGCINGTIPHIKCGTAYLINVPVLVEQLNKESAIVKEEN